MSDTRAALVWVSSIGAFWAGWLASNAFAVPQLWYLPLAHGLTFGAHPPGLAMGMYGQLLCACAAGGGVGGLLWRVNRGREETRIPVGAMAAVCALMLGLEVGWVAVSMWGRVLPAKTENRTRNPNYPAGTGEVDSAPQPS